MRPCTFVRNGFLALGLVVAATAITAAEAQQRLVTVNGVVLGPQELAVADRAAGFRLPSGHYWLDHQSGYWGVVGGPAVGRVPPQLLQGGGQGGSHRNSNVGVGAITNPDGATWQDQVWIDWD